MKLNSPAMLETAEGLIARHGSWDAVREASLTTADGVYVVDPDPIEIAKALERLSLVRSAPS